MATTSFSELRKNIQKGLAEMASLENTLGGDVHHSIPLRDIEFLELTCKLIRLELDRVKRKREVPLGETSPFEWRVEFNDDQLGVIATEIRFYLGVKELDVPGEGPLSRPFYNLFCDIIHNLEEKRKS